MLARAIGVVDDEPRAVREADAKVDSGEEISALQRFAERARDARAELAQLAQEEERVDPEELRGGDLPCTARDLMPQEMLRAIGEVEAALVAAVEIMRGAEDAHGEGADAWVVELLDQPIGHSHERLGLVPAPNAARRVERDLETGRARDARELPGAKREEERARVEERAVHVVSQAQAETERVARVDACQLGRGHLRCVALREAHPATPQENAPEEELQERAHGRRRKAQAHLM